MLEFHTHFMCAMRYFFAVSTSWLNISMLARMPPARMGKGRVKMLWKLGGKKYRGRLKGFDQAA